MKFNISAAFTLMTVAYAAAVPKPQVNEALEVLPKGVEQRATKCGIHTIWESNWRDGGYHRYRVRGTADTDGDKHKDAGDMLRKWCDLFLHNTDNVGGHNGEVWNPQCGLVESNKAYADVSVWIGENGLNIYRDFNQQVVNSWRAWTDFTCDVESSF